MTEPHVPDDGQIHGPELSEAMTDVAGPTELGICETALGKATDQVIDEQLKDSVDPEYLAPIRQMLLDAGGPFDDVTVQLMAIRSIIGGTFTYGIAVGREIARMEAAK